MERPGGRPFEVIIDLTMFSKTSEMPAQWVQQLMQLLSDEKSDNIAACYIYNPNSYLKSFVKKISIPFSPKLTKRMTFAATLAEIYEHILPLEVRLPKTTSKFFLSKKLVC